MNLSPLHSKAGANTYRPLCPDRDTEAWCRETCPLTHKNLYTQGKTKATQLGEGISAEPHQVYYCSLLGFGRDTSEGALYS